MKYILITLVLLLPGTGAFGEPRITSQEQRIEILERKDSEFYHDLKEKKTAGLASLLTPQISISGLLEIAAGAEKRRFLNADTDSSGDLSLATAQLGFDVKVNERISGSLNLLSEEGENFNLDEATINLAGNRWNGRFGLQYLPFGKFYSHFLSDPLTLILGETQQTAILGGYRHELFSLSAFVFNGDAEKLSEGEDHIRDWGASLSVTALKHVELGASYISDLTDTDAELALAVENRYRTGVGGWSVYTVVGFGAFEISAETLGAVESFATSDLDVDGDGAGDQPLAWDVELAWDLTEKVELAARYEGSTEFAGQPETQYGLCASWGVWENLSLSLEYLHGEFERLLAPVDESGHRQEIRELVTAQLAMIF